MVFFFFFFSPQGELIWEFKIHPKLNIHVINFRVTREIPVRSILSHPHPTDCIHNFLDESDQPATHLSEICRPSELPSDLPVPLQTQLQVERHHPHLPTAAGGAAAATATAAAAAAAAAATAVATTVQPSPKRPPPTVPVATKIVRSRD